jgi:hypothetical protein
VVNAAGASKGAIAADCSAALGSRHCRRLFYALDFFSMAEDSPTEGFKRHSDYPKMMDGSRRPSATLVGGPAVNHHLGFWVPAPRVWNYGPWIEEIEKFAVRLVLHLQRQGLQPVLSGLAIGADGSRQLNLFHNSYSLDEAKDDTKIEALPEGYDVRHHTFTVNFTWQSMPVSIRLQMHEESFALTTNIDLARSDPKLAAEPQNAAAALLYKSVEALRQSIEPHISGAPTQEGDQGKREQLYQDVYHKIWGSFDQAIFARPRSEIDTGNFGEVFVDFRSVVLDQGTKGQALTPPEDAVRHANAIRSFMEAGDPDHHTSPEPGQITASQLLGNYIYASALGAQPRGVQARGSQKKNQPLTFLLLAPPGQPVQTGWLLDLLHSLGMLRVAALRNLERLTRASPALRDLEREIKELTVEAGQGKGRAALDRTVDELISKLPEFEQRLNEIGQQKDKDGRIIGGLPQRVERSLFYQSQFEDRVRELGIEPIRGFVPYDKAVSHRLGGNHKFIRLVGDRYDRLQRLLDGLNQYVRTVEAVRAQKQSVEFQRIAEFFAFIVFLSPVIETGLKYLFREDTIANLQAKRIIFASSIGISGLFAMHRRWRKLFRLAGRGLTRVKAIRKVKHRFRWKRRVLKNTRKLFRNLHQPNL